MKEETNTIPEHGLCFLDTETTGLDAKKQDIIQIGCILMVDGEVVETLEFKCKPFDPTTISPFAVKVHKMGVDQMLEFPDPVDQCKMFVETLQRYAKRYTMIAYNAKFDMRFLREWALKCKNPDLMCMFMNVSCVMEAWKDHRRMSNIKTKNNKLTTVCEYFGVRIHAHDALNDIKATKEIWDHLGGKMVEG